MRASRAADLNGPGAGARHLGSLLVHRTDPVAHLGEASGDLRIVEPHIDVLLDDVVLARGSRRQRNREPSVAPPPTRPEHLSRRGQPGTYKCVSRPLGQNGG